MIFSSLRKENEAPKDQALLALPVARRSSLHRVVTFVREAALAAPTWIRTLFEDLAKFLIDLV